MAKYKVGDIVEVVGPGLITKGRVGKIIEVDEKVKGWPYTVYFSKYSDCGRFTEKEITRANSKGVSSNEIVANAIAKKAAVAKNADFNLNEIKALSDKWCSLVPKCAAMKRELERISGKLDDTCGLGFEAYVLKKEHPELQPILKRLHAVVKDADYINTSTSDFHTVGY